ncbi:MAG: class I SAM-dependent methyltransferase [Spirochaetaceae bacterium]|nr:class I SAM-dependent methyltransferase [Spirochaetaceae bacterium]
MTTETAEKLAASLSAETGRLLPFLPYLLQDFWTLGSEPKVMAQLLKDYANLPPQAKVLELACGKGAVAIKIAQELQVKVKGIDIIIAFTEVAAQKACEYKVDNLCRFTVDDINEAVQTERDYDVVILGGVGSDVLGGPAQTLSKLKAPLKAGGYILIDEVYLNANAKHTDLQYDKNEYLYENEWLALFKEAGLQLVKTILASDIEASENLDKVTGMAAITQRANELMLKYPAEKELFASYIRSQQAEYNDLDDSLVGVAWLLKKND